MFWRVLLKIKWPNSIITFWACVDLKIYHHLPLATKNSKIKTLVIGSRLLTCETSYVRSTCWNLSLWQAGFCESFATQAKSRVTCETLYLIIFSMSFLISLQILYKPSLLTKCKKNKEYSEKLLKEKTLAKHLRVRDCLSTILYIISLEFPFTPTSPSTHFEC